MKSIFKESLILIDFGLTQIYEFEKKVSEAAGDHFQLVSEKKKGYLLFKEKFLGDVLYERVSTGNINFQSKVNAEMRKSVTYTSNITLSAQNEVLSTSCSCVIGQIPATCKHVFAVFHLLMEYSEKEMFLAPTEKLQEWHKPKVSKVAAKPFDEVFGKKGVVPKRELNFSALFTGKVSNSFLSVLGGSEEVMRNHSIPLPACVLSHRPESPLGQLPFEQFMFLFSNLKFDLEDMWHLESITTEQSGSDEWKKERRSRVTASNFHAICHTTDKRALVQRILSPVDLSRIKPVVYGRENEPYVRNMVRSLYPNHVIRKVGLVTNPFMPHLGASPDGLLYNVDGSTMLLEIKCVFNESGKDLEELAANKNFCLINKNGNWRLKENHSYYSQIQGQLALSNLQDCLFVLYYKKPNLIFQSVIKFNFQFWQNMYPKITEFYLNDYLPILMQQK